jgi:adenylate cyclase
MRITRRVNTSASEARLGRLIEERVHASSEAEKQRIDQRIWDLFGETWCVMFTDLVGFSRAVEAYGITHFLQTIFAAESELVPLIDEHDGIVLKSEGDSMLVIFRNPSKALACSVAMQRHLHRHNQDASEAEDILLCIGLGYGHLLKIGDADVFGAQVNAASKLGEDTAKAWEILVTDAMKDAVAGDAALLDAIGVSAFEPIDTTPPGAKAAFKVCYAL